MTTLRLPAVELRQGTDRVLYSFAVDGKDLPRFTAVSRIHRHEGEIGGYQRPEVRSHIANIRRYIESENPMVPNALVVAFDGRVRFEPHNLAPSTAFSRYGVLAIPVDDSLFDEEKPGWIVDGQQRAAAIRDAEVTGFPVFVTAFVTSDLTQQREQFILVNSAKPLPRGLIYELLPSTDARLPDVLMRRRLPAAMLERLNLDPASPLCGLIRTPTTPDGVIQDNSILRMLENSLNDGALYRLREDVPSALGVLHDYWRAVAATWPEAWGVAPRKSRLMHGAGIVGMGLVMDALHDAGAPFAEGLAALKPVCRWTSGTWDFGGGVVRTWSELQNTPNDLRLLADFLLRALRAAHQESKTMEGLG